MLTLTVRHWLPVITFCPVNNLPDALYVSLEFDGKDWVELYTVRKTVRKLVRWRKMYMEDVAKLISRAYPNAKSVTVRLAFNRHVVTITRG